jgi:preprotein translocase SecF subunit
MALQKPPLYQGKVTPTLGADFINRSVKAGAIALLVIMLFMILYYRLPGVLASLALIFYVVIILALFKLWPGGGVTLTLGGLGGFILSLGMAVDANVLIFERLKEELQAGRTLGAAVDAGFHRAWSAIRDSNLTTFIACGILYWLGKNVVASGPVTGFALTLFIGVAVSMFTAITVTRTFLQLFVGSRLAQRTSLFSPYTGQESDIRGGTLFDIVNKRFWLLSFSGVVLVICIVAPIVLGLKPAVEFKSGSMMTVSFAQPVEQAQLRQELSSLGYPNSLVQGLEGGSYLIRTQELSADEKTRLESALQQKFGRVNEDQFFSVSPLVAAETVRNTAIAVAVSLIGMLLYMAWAFRKVPNSFRFGTCAIVALLHDVVVIVGVFAIVGSILSWQVDLLFITGILTIVGYAINNTIVVFDRIRENASRGLSSDFAGMVNNSIVQTLTRSLNTTLTTIFGILALMLFVGSSLQNLNVVLLVGLTAGFFSSVFVAPLLLLVWHGAGWGFKLKATSEVKTKKG